jgi:hypothetical protein
MPLIDTNGLEMPSCEAEVGTLMNGLLKSNATIFAISTDRPPPKPRITSGILEFIASSRVLTESIVAALTIYHESLNEKSFRDD